jgi:tRNA pseudouridine32 synthase/23S rRNA pseudouridine746 synthase
MIGCMTDDSKAHPAGDAPAAGAALRRSFVALPPLPPPYPTLVRYLTERFPHVGLEQWTRRIREGRVLDEGDRPVGLDTPYRPYAKLTYWREVADEAPVPFAEQILHRDERVVVAFKPHFLPVTPSGGWVNECLLYRLLRRTGLRDLAPIHRLDRETAGLVLFAVRREDRDAYGRLFREGRIRRQYEAIARIDGPPALSEWQVESRIERGEPWFLSREVEGPPNARTRVRWVESGGAVGRFILEPSTGKQHQLRLHMARIGHPIVNDWYYPVLREGRKPGFDHPLMLLARELEFEDPLDGAPRHWRWPHGLAWPGDGADKDSL